MLTTDTLKEAYPLNVAVNGQKKVFQAMINKLHSSHIWWIEALETDPRLNRNCGDWYAMKNPDQVSFSNAALWRDNLRANQTVCLQSLLAQIRRLRRKIPDKFSYQYCREIAIENRAEKRWWLTSGSGHESRGGKVLDNILDSKVFLEKSYVSCYSRKFYIK